jgi:hypothetical protein
MQVKLAVQSQGWAQVAGWQRCIALHTMLGPQSGLVLHPLVQRFCGYAPPCMQTQGLSQMRPAPASWQSALA